MRNIILGAAAAIALCAEPAWAGIYADDATRCLVKSTNETDQTVLVKWIFMSMALHPSIKEYSNITADQRKQADQQVGVLVRKLLTQSCRKETVDAIKYEGPGFLEKSFTALGEIAMGGLMSNPDVAKGLGTWAAPEDIEAFKELGAEAGRPTPATP
jgi:hypothetical protein